MLKQTRRFSVNQKYDALMEYCRNSSGKGRFISYKTVDKDGRPVGKYKQEFRIAFNKGTLKLSQNKIDNLQKMRILAKTEKEYDDMSKQYGIPANKIKRIERDWESVENVVERFKHSKFVSDYMMEYYGIKDYSAVILSRRDITVQDKSGIVRFVIDAFAYLKNNIVGTFINKDYVDEVLSSLSEQERYIVEMIYGINGKTNTSKIRLSKKMGMSITDLNKILKKAIAILLSKNAVVFRLEDLTTEIDRLNEKAKIAKLEGNIQSYNRIIQKIEQVKCLIQECNRAYDRFIKDENIFRDDDVIPASGKAHIDFLLGDNERSEQGMIQDVNSLTTDLSAKERKKFNQMKEIEQLQTLIDEQSEKESQLSGILQYDSKEIIQ